ncbi:hypothetical protein AB1286_19935 [Trinickia sp. NRRL B-1857]|uniref:hypothetical protein n=1 Tax=Trinickia sp. NRRL B-1857 TaxID=3162879 RepID=UPI003D2A7B97
MDDHMRRRIQKALRSGKLPNMRKPVFTSGYVPPATGVAHARLVGYFELGTHEEEFEGMTRDREKVALVFELSGLGYGPRIDGAIAIPQRLTVQETLNMGPNSSFFQLFGVMNYAGKATHMAELLGEAFIVEVFHKKSKDGKKVYANLKGPNGYNVKGTTVQDPLSGKPIVIDVQSAITELKAFIWDIADKEMWDSIYIPGEWEERKDEKTGEVILEARTKNVIQQKLMSAKNWLGSPAHRAITPIG